MTFDNVETVAEVTHVPSFAAPPSSTWYRWDEDFSEHEADSSMLEVETEEEEKTLIPLTNDVAEKPSAFSPVMATVNSLAHIVSNTVSYLSYTRRWYTSLSSVGAAM